MAFLFPELAKLIDCVGREASVVIVGVGVDGDAAMADLETEIDPAHYLGRTIDDGLFPLDGFPFDPFAVTEPADVSPIGGNGIELPFEFVRGGHGGEVLEDERDFVTAEDAGEVCVEPRPVADFDGEFFVGREFGEERLEEIEEVALRGEFYFFEERELEDERAEFFFEDGGGIEKFGEIGVGVFEKLVVGDDVGNFEGEEEVRWSLVVPILDGFGAGRSVESGIDFDGVEASGVEGEAVGGFQVFGIESALPAVGGEGRGAEMDGRGGHEWSWSEYSWRESGGEFRDDLDGFLCLSAFLR